MNRLAGITRGASFAVGVAAYAAYLFTAGLVQTGSTKHTDRAAELDVHHTIAGAAGSLLRFLSVIGNEGEMFGAALLLAALLWYRSRRVTFALYPAVAVGGAILLDWVDKLIFARPRPHLWAAAEHPASFSFPSGHATASAALAAAVFWLYYRTGRGKWAVGPLVIFALLVGLSRVYLGAHWPSDVLAGELLALTWCSLCAAVVLRT